MIRQIFTARLISGHSGTGTHDRSCTPHGTDREKHSPSKIFIIGYRPFTPAINAERRSYTSEKQGSRQAAAPAAKILFFMGSRS